MRCQSSALDCDLALRMDPDRKHRHEQFIHGHRGGSPWEVFALITLTQLAHIHYASFLFAFPILRIETPRIKTFRVLLDFFLVYSPLILSLSLFHRYVYQMLATVVAVIIVNFFIYARRHGDKFSQWKTLAHWPIHYEHKTRLSYVSNLMSTLMMATCLAIFAVDFSVFDRRFAKTEMYGWSLMDIGVGIFIVLHGTLAPESRLANNSQISIRERTFKTVKSTLPLLTLGLIRLWTVKALNYQEHVSEYGLHWNFFFTVSFVKMFSCILCALVNVNLYVVSISIMILHQILLKTHWTEFVLNSDRESLFAANKEGLISLIGFSAIYLFYVQFGRNYLPRKKTIGELGILLLHIVLFFIQSTLIMFASHNLIEPISRREANLAFLCFIIACTSLNILVELIYFIWKQVARPRFRYQSVVFNALNQTGLLIFLIANLITGLVNLTIDTMLVGDYIAVILFHLYAAVLTVSGVALQRIFPTDR